MVGRGQAVEPGDERELRLALAMRGGVSLAVWIGGACAEIDELRRSDRDAGADPFWSELRRACGFSRVRVDVMSGASAGGLNGVLFAAAIRHGFRMGELLPIWEEVASLSKLRRTGPPWSSVLDGDGGFLDVIEARLADLVAGAPGEVEPQPVDLRLSATLVEPIVTAAVSPSDELLTRTRSEAGFHFRHDRTGAAPRTDLDGDLAVPRLAAAARATASFPVAFEAALVRSTRAGSFADAGAIDAQGSPTDCRGVFSDAAAPGAEDFVVADGGIVDNIPIGRALDAVAAASADGPTRRVVVYLHPTGPPVPTKVSADALGTDAAAAGRDRRAARAVLEGMVRARVQGETIDRDVEQLERFNASIRVGQMLRRSTVRFLPTEPGEDGVAVVRPTETHWQAYVVQRSAADAARLRRLLDDPLGFLGEDPFPVDGAGDDVWRAPIARWDRRNREDLDTGLSSVFADALDQTPGVGSAGGAVLRVGLSALRRSIDLVIEWCRYLRPVDDGAAGVIGDAKRRLYDLRSSVAVLERTRRLGWVTLAGHETPAEGALASVAPDSWAVRAVDAVDHLLMVSPGAAAALARPGPTAEPYLREVAPRLDGFASSGFAAVVVEQGTVDARGALVDALVEVTRTLVDLPPTSADTGSEAGGAGQGRFPDDHPGALADRVLRFGWGDIGARLVTLEILSLAEHLAGATPTIPIDFYRISAAAPCPLAAEFSTLRTRSDELGAPPPRPGDRADDLLRPDVKLAGNELANFSAFLDDDWRRNDWMWGRLDAVSGLVRLLVDSARVVGEDGSVSFPVRLCTLAGVGADATQDQIVRALVARRQDQVATDCGVPPEARAAYAQGLEDLTHPGSKEIRRTMVHAVGDGARVLRATVPGRWRLLVRPVGWVAQAIVWFRTRPTGKLPPPPERR